MNKVILLAAFFLFPATHFSVGFASPVAEVDVVSGACQDLYLAMAEAPVSGEKSKSPARADSVEPSPGTLAILIGILLLMIVVGVLRFRIMAMENDLL